MKIAVINGSPKGQYSITLQTVLYLQRKFPAHTFEVLHAGQRIKALEKDAWLKIICDNLGNILEQPSRKKESPASLPSYVEHEGIYSLLKGMGKFRTTNPVLSKVDIKWSNYYKKIRAKLQ